MCKHLSRLLVGATVLALLCLGAGDLALAAPRAASSSKTVTPLLHLGADGFYDAGNNRVPLHGFDTSGDGNPDPVAYKQHAALGGNFARLVVYWDEIEPNAPVGGVHTWNTTLLSQIDAEVQSLASQGVYVLVDFHMVNWSPWFNNICSCQAHGLPSWEVSSYPQTSAGLQQSQADWWTNAQGLSNYQAYAQMMVARYSAYSNVIAFGIFNEPAWGVLPKTHPTTQTVIGWQAQVANAIRAMNPQRAIAFNVRGGGDLGLMNVDLSPFGQTNDLLLDFHDYFSGHPGMGFTTDGEDWSPGWNPTHVQTETSYTGTLPDQDRILSYAIAQAAKLHLPMIVGEWGNVRTSTNIDIYQQQMLTLLTHYHLDWSRWNLARWSPWSMLNPDPTGTLTPQAQQIQQALLAPVTPVSAVAPAISGTLAVGQTLTVGTGTWTPAPVATFFQWQRCDAFGAGCAPIPGATGSSYTVTSADSGSALRADVYATNPGAEAVASALITPPSPPLNTAAPAVSGQALQGQTLTASTGTWKGTASSYAYQWQRCDSTGGACADVPGATTSGYTLAAADDGSTLQVTVTAANAYGQAQATSVPTVVVLGPPTSVLSPAITGWPTQGQALSASPGMWAGWPAPVVAYQWQRCDSTGASCVDVGGATGSTYTPVVADLGSTLTVVVTASNASGAARASSAATAVVSGPPASVSTPTLSGSPVEGQLLTASPGSWTGYPAPSLAYQWQRCNASGGSCADIAAATGSAYTLLAADTASTLRVVVTATSTAGSTPVASVATSVVASAPGPLTALLDDFNRANASGPPGPSWQHLPMMSGNGTNNLLVSGQQTTGVAGGNGDYWNAKQFGADSEAYVTVTAKPTADLDSVTLGLRLQSPGSLSTTSGYQAYFVNRSAGPDQYRIVVRTNSTISATLAALTGPELNPGDKLLFRAIGTRLELWLYDAGAWTLALNASDSTYTGGGYASLSARNTVVRLDDFGGGTLP